MDSPLCRRTGLAAYVPVLLFLIAGLGSAQALALPTLTLEDDGWHLITVPADPGADGSPRGLFGDDLPADSYGGDGTWVLFTYDAAAGQYVEVGVDQPLVANTAYWMIQATGSSVVIDVPDSLKPPASGKAPGCIEGAVCTSKTIAGKADTMVWNMVGVASELPVEYTYTRFVTPADSCRSGCTPAEVSAAGVAADHVYRYESTGAESDYSRVEVGASLQPWEGYWLSTLGAAPSAQWLLPLGSDKARDEGGDPDSEPNPTERDANRLLAQGSFGATEATIDEVLELGGAAGWIDAQLALPAQYHLPIVKRLFPDGHGHQSGRYEAFWQRALRADDQLRQRVAFALSQIMVVSDKSDAMDAHGNMLAAYQDILLRHAFGNYRDLLRSITLNPAMGVFLSMQGNEKPDAETGKRADENFAREVMQLFTIGLDPLNLDGSSSGSEPTYTQADVENLARVFTGWSWARDDWRAGNNPGANGAEEEARLRESPMKAFPEYHDTDSKTFLGNTFPAGQSAQQDLDAALDTLFNHPNVGPFIGRQLIQRLVTSNPSPAYISRVAATFNDNGAGERGDLAAVVRAILLDAEARDPGISENAEFGKLREPILRYAHLWRAFDVAEPIRPNKYQVSQNPQLAPLTAPSVFNFFSPDYSPSGAIRQAGLIAPEFQINSETAASTVNDGLMRVVQHGGFIYESPTTLKLDDELELVAAEPAALLDHLDRLLLGSRMSEALRSVLTDYMAQNSGEIDDEKLVRDIVGLVITSPDHAVQR